MRRNRTIPILGAISWLLAVCAGLGILVHYAGSPGTQGKAPSHWPRESKINFVSGKATLVMTVHPRCPCSRASISELAALMAQSRGVVSANVLFWKPKGYPESWAKRDLWQSASAIPGVTVIIDEEGREAARYCSQTSGQTVIYNAEGTLKFSGGITGARGHAGDNIGRSAAVSWLTKNSAEISTAPVFGCSLSSSNSGLKN